MALRRAALVALVAAAVLVPATGASASHHAVGKIRLSLVPLQTAQLGPENASLALNYGSGPFSYYNNRFRLFGINFFSGGSFSRLGGYVLDYGDPFAGSTGVMEIRSSVERYRTRADARKDRKSTRLNSSHRL